MLVQLGLGLRIITKTAKSPVILRSRMKLSTNVRAAIQLGLYKYCESQYEQDATMISSCFFADINSSGGMYYVHCCSLETSQLNPEVWTLVSKESDRLLAI